MQSEGRQNRNRGKRWRRRLLAPDLLRGATLLSMIGYHGMWDAVFLFGVAASWYTDLRGYVWQQSICWTFLLLSGFSCRFSRNLLRRGAEVFFAGALVTLVTLLVIPEDRVVFGILTCIGSCMILTGLYRKYCGYAARRRMPDGPGISGTRRKPDGPGISDTPVTPGTPDISGVRGTAGMPGYAGAAAGLAVSALFFFLTRDVNSGRLGFEGIAAARLPEILYRNLFTAYLGFPPEGFFSTDYFSVIPWFFLFLCGYFLHPLLIRNGVPGAESEADPCPAQKKGLYGNPLPLPVRTLAFLGRHTLPVYLLHQPLLLIFLNLVL